MTWNGYTSFPRAILHIDGDSFFASCEMAKDPTLRGKPVITGKERGIVSAASYEAKARGVKRGMRLFEVRKLCPDAVILPSDYESYSLFAERMYEIVRRYTPEVEEYSIDECFADLTGMRRANRMSYPQMAERIQSELDTELGMTFSIGLSCTKVLAKMGSKWKKPHGLTIIPLNHAQDFLAKTPAESVWGIGPQTAAYLKKYGIHTALQLAQRDEAWVKRMLSKPFQEIWRELRGDVAYELDVKGRHTYQSIQKTKTFTPPSTDPSFVYSQLSKNVENACIKARRWGLASAHISFFLKTQEFTYTGLELTLSHPTNVPQDMLKAIAPHFSVAFKKGTRYRATGITLAKLQKDTPAQLDIFGAVEKTQGVRQVLASVDKVSAKYGKHSVFLGSSFKAMRFGAHLGERGDMAKRTRILFKGETPRRRLAIPCLGEVQ